MTTITADIVALLRSRGEHDSYKGDRLYLDAADENERLRDCLSHIRRHVNPFAARSGLARVIVATCDSGLTASEQTTEGRE